MPTVATGSFTVELTPEGEPDTVEGVSLGRMSLVKRFVGDLAGAGSGTMLSARGAADGSAGYVAIERVVGTLHGKAGSFVLQHSGTMHAGDHDLSITVVPGSGTGDLAGLSGALTLTIVDGRHDYALEYSLPE